MSDSLVAAIAANPDDADAYLVYADWLQSQGDPRGELIVLHHQGKLSEAFDLIAAKGEHFLGPFVNFLEGGPKPKRRDRVFQLEWQLGFIKKAHLGWETRGDRTGAVEEFEKFLALPSAQFLQELVIGPVVASDFMNFKYWLEPLAEAAPKTLRVLVAGDVGHYDISMTAINGIEEVLAACPQLRSLTIHAGEISLGKLEHAELRELRVETGGIGGVIDTVSSAKLPNLERLEVWLGTPRYGGSTDVADVAGLLEGSQFPKLVHLGIMNCVYTDEVARRLIESKILPRLKTLDLSMGTLSDDGVRAMVDAKSRFAHLELLNLDDNAMTDASQPLVEGLAKYVNFGGRHDDERIAEEDIEDRYTSVGE